jgi:gamma-glutamyltranspeptidase/glutathione hydrolase
MMLQEQPKDRHTPFNYTGKRGMVVAAHPLAAQAGLKMLKAGGNAVDAAVATAFALNAAEPFASGIGGGGFMLIYLAKTKKVTAVNYREKAPAAAHPRMFKDKGEAEEEWRTLRGTAVGVPGALAGWEYALRKYGTRSLADAAREAISIAENGFPVSLTFSTINKDEYEKLLKNAGETSCYLNRGVPFEPGDVLRNPELAATLKLIGSRGIREFYEGAIARKIVKAVQDKGGAMTLEDLKNYAPQELKPIEGTYKKYTLFTIPPPGSGGLHVIQLLNVAERWPLKEWGFNSPRYIHHLGEALRFIFAGHDAYLGDPDFVSIPLAGLLSKQYAGDIAAGIRPDKVAESYLPGRFDERQNHRESTTHLCVIDKEGNIVALTQSINHFFSTGIVPEGTGFLLNNHMDDFAADPDSPNAPNANRRPLSSMGPLILCRDGVPYVALGSPGGTRIFPSLTQILLNILEFGMSLDEAIEAPRFFTYSAGGKSRSVSVESRVPDAVLKELERMGHKITVREAYDKYFGGAQGIMVVKPTKLLHGGADSRRDGTGAGF